MGRNSRDHTGVGALDHAVGRGDYVSYFIVITNFMEMKPIMIMIKRHMKRLFSTEVAVQLMCKLLILCETLL